ncbi:endoglucanase-4 [Phyllosticta capitalensis]|uniref:glycosyl hydrolase family 61-domain-containing protein n=1 Tax=Phyllosticta capitalensis TaxID=121624 RepID=UPI00312E9E90
MSAIFKNAALLGALASTAAAHGTLQGIVADGTYYEGYSPSFQYQTPAPVVIGWSIPEDLDNGYVAPDAYTNANIICHKGATNAKTSAPIKAGSNVTLEWTEWPESHHGPVISYLANCKGNCTTVDKTTLEWVKIDAAGLIDDSSVPGTWASDELISNNNSWVTTIPSSIAAGNYVLRNEIIALHGAESKDGAQNYPQCINLEITGSGTDDLSTGGTLGTKLYTETDPGILVNIYASLSTYVIPGPTLYTAGSGAAATGASSAAAATTPASSAAQATTPAATTPAAQVTSSAAAVVSTSSAVAVAEVSSAVTPTAATPVAATPAASDIAGLSSLIPTSVATQAVTAVATATGVPKPEAQLPDNFTVKQLMQWFEYVVANILKGANRQHARDLSTKA